MFKFKFSPKHLRHATLEKERATAQSDGCEAPITQLIYKRQSH